MQPIDYRSEIEKLKKEKNAVILGHYYQIPEVQDISDFVGDSLALAEAARETDAEMIVFCGVHFMAETAKILNPHKKVVLPDMEAGCSLADSCPADKLQKLKDQHPDAMVISYINCTAEVKTLSDLICTSGNAIKLVESFPKDQKIIFAPDKNLGGYINRMTGRNMILWDGVCEVHDILLAEKAIQMKAENLSAKMIAHPECNAAVLEVADFTGSTAAMLKYVKQSPAKEFIVATETGILHQMEKENPDKLFRVLPTDETCACNDCKYMKLNTMEKLYQCLSTESPEIILPEDLIKKAKSPIIRMLDLSRELGII